LALRRVDRVRAGVVGAVQRAQLAGAVHHRRRDGVTVGLAGSHRGGGELAGQVERHVALGAHRLRLGGGGHRGGKGGTASEGGSRTEGDDGLHGGGFFVRCGRRPAVRPLFEAPGAGGIRMRRAPHP
jgi:hypothetical protein